METPKPNNVSNNPSNKTKPKEAAGKTPVKTEPVKVPPMFRKIDWVTMGITFLVVWGIYIFTLAPELTLEDSGELCTGSFYAGIPHPPGYPFWAIYSWFWTFILPFGNVAWRVEMGESFAAAMGCGMVALMVSRGGSMLIEGIEAIKSITRQWENSICIISGFVAGTLLGLDGFMWKESVAINRISLFGVPWLILVMCLLFRWSYAPQQKRYAYLALLCYGICTTIHQTLLMSAMGLEVLLVLTYPKLGRDALAFNTFFYLAILLLKNVIPAFQNMTNVEWALLHAVGLSSGITTAWLISTTKGLMTEIKTGVIMFLCFCVGVSFYFYEAISGMTVPPMQWGYPRTVEGFFHALGRGQYETAHALDIFSEPSRFVFQIWYILQGLADSFSWVYMFIGILPFLFLMKMQKRERNWIISVAAVYFCVSVLLGIMLNVSPERSSSDLNKVFYTASHGLFALMIGYGLTLLAAYVATHYQNFRRWGLVGGSLALLLAVYCLVDATGKLYFGPAGGFDAEHAFLLGILILCGLAALALLYVKIYKWIKSFNDQVLNHFYLWGLPAVLAVGLLVARLAYPEKTVAFFGAMKDTVTNFAVAFVHSPGQVIHSTLPHYIGQAFAPDQYGLPVLSSLILLLLSVLFIVALLVYRTRGPVAILLGIFLLMPLCSGLNHWYKSEQRNHWFGYWFGHDMFTPPFTDPATGKLSYDNVRRAELLKDPKNAKLIYPEMARDTILFGGTDPGRFCPTYIIFCESFIPHRCQPAQDQKFDRRDVYIITQNALADGTYLNYLRSQYNRSAQKDPPFFSELSKYVFSLGIHGWRSATGSALDKNVDPNIDPQTQEMLKRQENLVVQGIADSGLYHLVYQALYYTLDVPFTKWGKHVEARRRAEEVYPAKEIYIPSEPDLQDCFQEYARVKQLNANGGSIQISGQVDVMNINGMLCRVIFDHNPTNEFYVEESFPLEWMYPYETPFSVIMKINRNPLPELTQDVFDLDHKFWTDFAPRLCGNWITYNTTVKEICDYAQRTYVENNYKGYTGDRAFVRDDDAQKAFSKLRSSQAGMYAWRLSQSCPQEYRQKSKETQDALVRETDFAFKQAFAFCPYSPEAVFRYANFLMQLGRFDDTILIFETCLKLDPFNEEVRRQLELIKQYRDQYQGQMKAVSQVEQMEKTARENPNDVHNLVVLGVTYASMQQTNRATELLDQALANTNASASDVGTIAAFYSQVNNLPKLEAALQKLAELNPDQPEPHYDLAALQSFLGHTDPALNQLKIAMELSAQRLKTNPTARNLLVEARKDPHLNNLRALPDFAKIVPPQ